MTFSKLQNSQAVSLYEQDFNLWLKTTINHLKEEKFSQIDIINLMEELESMGRSEKHALESNLRVLLLHLLKYKYQPSKRSKSWLSSIIEHRIRIRKALRASPSFKRYVPTTFAETYQDSRKLASAETGLTIETFPELCPFTLEETLQEEFYPTEEKFK
ncbi:MAG: DUF29 domain-containing protein [Microcystaceae cyanobacterium]